ncbi:uncharacterized protein LOC109849448 [Asparagus officinalis]|uniref:uncharacterized protein LOC109849448 n=1 Tax=Asparagus officinalis TaxID=4686 RepID=UPI00098E2CA2|nr:uncharacterized protein LOC109849448 [Asparagus officinalis]
MGRPNTSFCLNRFPLCFRVGSPRKMDPKPISAAVGSGSDKSWSLGSETGGRRIMVVVNSSRESKTALQWTLSHTVQNHDTIVVVAVIKPTSTQAHGDLSEKKKDPRKLCAFVCHENFLSSQETRG